MLSNFGYVTKETLYCAKQIIRVPEFTITIPIKTNKMSIYGLRASEINIK